MLTRALMRQRWTQVIWLQATDSGEQKSTRRLNPSSFGRFHQGDDVSFTRVYFLYLSP